MITVYWQHHHDGPWRDAPPWAIELREMLRVVIQQGEINMTVQDDLVAAVATLTDNVAKHDVTVQAEIAAYAAAKASGDTTGMQAAIDNISKASATIATETANLAASLPQPPTPAPAPAPTDTPPTA